MTITKKKNVFLEIAILKFIFSKKATKIDQIDGEDFFNSSGLFRKHEL